MKQVWGNGEHATALTVAEMRAADAYTIAHFTPGRELMRRAAEGVYGAVAWHGRTAILAGGGNNGGDGYALAGILAAAGMPPDVFAVSEKLSEDGRFYREQAQARGVRILPFNGETSLSGYDILVDCILGTGFCGEVRGLARHGDCAHQRSEGSRDVHRCGGYQQRHERRYRRSGACRMLRPDGIHRLL